jgi:hypothetical protein
MFMSALSVFSGAPPARRGAGKHLALLLALVPLLGPSQAETKEAKVVQVPLHTWYSASRGDYFSTTDPQWRGRPGDKRAPDYVFVRVEGGVLAEPLVGTRPLYHWWSPARGDNFVTTDAAWAGKPGDKRGGYLFGSVLGHVWQSAVPGARALRLFWSGKQEDNHVASDLQAPVGYVGGVVQGYVMPVPGAGELLAPGNTCGNLGQACCREGRQCVDGVTCDGFACVACPAPAPPPLTQESFSRSNVYVGSRCLGLQMTIDYGGSCSTGFHQGECTVKVIDACDSCTAEASWLAPGVAGECRCRVEFRTPADCFKGILVDIMVTETQDVVRHGLLGCPGSW